MVYIRFAEEIKNAMIKHTLKECDKEVGGFLYGNIHRENDDIFFDVDALYYEDQVGSDNEFNFRLSYIYNAKKTLKNLKSQLLLGTYHSHGKYPAIFSNVDREQLQKYFGSNKITIIYSPGYGQLIGEYMDENGTSHKAKIMNIL